ncbi:MAG TPA: SulP family inorganic anion transporter [Myxococcota bacterium]|nr:SulP family inorganic anion transporter [Myxococcota bacterium]
MIRLLPFLKWFKGYTATSLRADLLSGVTVALVLIPQSMAYAQLAGLPAYYGLYAAFLPPMVAALFGSSNQLATGPVAVVSLMTAAALEPLATAGSAEYIAYAILLALLVGVFQLLLGILRLGLIVNFLSHPVVNGFTNAAAIIIATSQLSKIFGIYVDKAPHHYQTVYRVIAAAVNYTNLPTLGMAALAFGLMIGLKKLDRRIPNVLVAVVLTILIAVLFGFEKNETVSHSRIESTRLAGLVTRFNRAVADEKQIENLRLALNKAPVDREKEGNLEGVSCATCHRKAELGMVILDRIRPGTTEGQVLAMHNRAGLLDRRISELKQAIGKHREQLRHLFFEAVEDGEGLRFYTQGTAPVKEKTVGGTWRIKIENNPLDLDALTMMGGGAVVAGVPPGLPGLDVPQVDWSIVPQLFFMAMIISLLGFMEAISIAKAMAARTHQRLDPNQELIGQGLANIAGCFTSSYAVSGSFSRSAVNLQAGAKTGLSSVFSSGVVVIVLLFFTPLLYHLPQAVLAAIIMMAVFGLLNVKGFIHAWEARRFDGITAIITLLATLFFAPHLEYGIFIGVALSLGAYLMRTMKPHMAELSLHPDGSLRDARRHGLSVCRHVAAVRFDGPLNFVNATYLEDEILKLNAEMPALKCLLLAAHGINEIDASGEETLSLLVDRLRAAGYEIAFSGVKEEVLDAMNRTHLFEKIGAENFYPTQLQAVSSIYARAHLNSDEKNCPLENMQPHIADLSLHPDGSLREARRHNLALCQHIAALRFDSPLNAATSSYLEKKIRERVALLPKLKHVLLAAHGINDVDSYGMETIRQVIEWLRGAGIKFSLSGVKENVLDNMRQAGLVDIIGEKNIYPTQLKAISSIHEEAHRGSTEKRCPLIEVVP